MMFKNTFKLLFANYSKVWRVFLYTLIALAITFGLAVAVGFPIYNKLLESGIFTQLSDLYMDFVTRLNLQTFIAGLGDWLVDLIDVVFVNIGSLLIYFILLIFIVVIFGSIIIKAYEFGVCGSMNYFMNSGVNMPFIQSMLVNIRKNLLYQLINILILIPINLGITIFVVFTINIFTDITLIWLAPFVAIAVYTLLNSLKIAVFGSWIPAMVVKNYGVWQGLKENFRVLPRRFVYTFGSALGLTLTIVAVNVLGGICTFGVGLLITVPASMCAVCIFNMIAYYTAIGQRYYADSTSICAPKRQEFTDQFNNHKYII